MTCYKLSTERIENTQTQEKLNLGQTFKGF